MNEYQFLDYNLHFYDYTCLKTVGIMQCKPGIRPYNFFNLKSNGK